MNQEELKKLLAIIYKEIDSECITETDTVKMITISNILVKHGANINDLD